MKNLKEEFKYSKNGITLIALVITIIIIIILSTVAISFAFGDNGLIKRAEDAKEANNKVAEREKLQLEIMGSYGTDGKIDIDRLNENLKNIGVEDAKITKLPAKVDIKGNTYVITGNGSINDLISMTEAQSDNMLTSTENSAVEDEYGNIVIVPAGFKITNDATKVTQGIVIEDNDIVTYDDGTKSTGNQFVWVPVGKIYTTADEATKESTTKTIKLSRYEFETDGTPIDRGSSAILGSYNFTEDTTEGNNTHAINITDFKNKTNSAGGYYIARYEASYGTDGKANSKISTGEPIDTTGIAPTTEGILWNNITQPDAAKASRAMYTSEEFTSDLANSYAWDTAIVFIQTFGGADYEAYSMQDGMSINSNLTNTGVNGDNPLNINDMASNIYEWTTENHSRQGFHSVYRGGVYNNSDYYTSSRVYSDISSAFTRITFRPLLYVSN